MIKNIWVLEGSRTDFKSCCCCFSAEWARKALLSSWVKTSVIIPSEESPATSAAGGGLERTQWERLPLVGLGNRTAWPDAPYCSQGRGGSDGGLRWEGPTPWRHLKRWDCAEGVWVRTELGAVGGYQAGPALARPLLKTTGPLGSHMWTTFLLLFLLIALPWDTLAASHLFIHSQPLFQMWNSGLKPPSSVSRLMACLFFHGLCPLLLGSFDCAEHPLGNRHLAHVQFLEVRTVCGRGHVNSGVCTCMHVCVPICDACSSPV